MRITVGGDHTTITYTRQLLKLELKDPKKSCLQNIFTPKMSFEHAQQGTHHKQREMHLALAYSPLDSVCSVATPLSLSKDTSRTTLTATF